MFRIPAGMPEALSIAWFMDWSPITITWSPQQVTSIVFHSPRIFESGINRWSDSLENLLGTSANDAQDHVRCWLSHTAIGMRMHDSPHSESCHFFVEWTDDFSDPESWQRMTDVNFDGDLVERSADLPDLPDSMRVFYRIGVSEGQE
ncbi:MAG: hypothetical protein Q7R22_007225 [Verrucomicrobiota bacterium JB025]|nr:hypothetical protein [Verrucomicrobiota bacterium JB025]